MKNNEDQVVYLDSDQAEELVERIADRAKNFHHVMTTSEKEAMSQLLSDIGVKVSDIIDVANLADNYAINAEIISPDETEQYTSADLRDSLFTWEESDGTHYCYSW